jgi:hypothetical protein
MGLSLALHLSHDVLAAYMPAPCYTAINTALLHPAAADHLDLAVLLEATELYCLVSPDNQEKLDKDAWVTLYQSTDASPYPAQVKFAAACGEALLSIAEYLVEDVLLVSSSGAAAGRTAGSTPDSTSTSSSSSRPRAGSGNAAVTLQHRIQWAQVAATTLGHLMRHQQLPVVDHPAHGSYLEQEGEYPAGLLARCP